MDEAPASVDSIVTDPPPAGEEIHLPGPSILPLLLAVGITVALIGVTISPILVVAGVALTIPVLVRWIREARAELHELPPGPH
jgi:Flp pilus assembly protein TadB